MSREIGIMASFFDRIRHGIETGVNTVTVRSREVVETTRIRAQLGTLRRRKQQALEELGRTVYRMVLANDLREDAVRAGCEEIIGIDDQIKAKEEELRQASLKAQEALGVQKAVGTCECGARLYEGMNYCTRCGRKVGGTAGASAAEEAAEAEKICPRCASSVPSGGRFCPNCGQDVSPS